ncbi:MAG: N-acetylglucosamine kinase [Roseibium sp.]
MTADPEHNGRPVLIGVDGGGTGCRAAVADLQLRRLGEGTGGPANFTTDPQTCLRNLRAVIDAAGADAGLSAMEIAQATVHAGIAGIMTPADARDAAEALPFARVDVTDDRPTMMAGALGARDGLLAAIGTGSFVGLQRCAERRFFGGYGLQVGDQASGSWLGRAALERTLLAHDGLAGSSGLTAALLARFGGDAVAVSVFAYGASPAEFAEFAPMVLEGAESGDPVASALMAEGAAYLRRVIVAAGLAAEDVICLAGGIGPHYASRLAPEDRNRLRAPQGTALDGALFLARALHAACP